MKKILFTLLTSFALMVTLTGSALAKRFEIEIVNNTDSAIIRIDAQEVQNEYAQIKTIDLKIRPRSVRKISLNVQTSVTGNGYDFGGPSNKRINIGAYFEGKRLSVNRTFRSQEPDIFWAIQVDDLGSDPGYVYPNPQGLQIASPPSSP